MPIQVADNFKYSGAKPLDSRIQYSSIADMKAVPEATLYDGCTAYVTATKKKYTFDSSNTSDETFGKWREDTGGGGGGVSDYSELTGKPKINNVELSGNKTSGDLGIIDETVNNLVNYYLKTETYTKAEVDALAAAIKNSRFEAVSELPTTDIQTNVIYLVPSSDPQTANAKDEYINLDGTTAGWEQIGSTAIDLSGYVTTTDLNTALADYTTTANLTTLLTEKQDKAQFGVMPNASIDYAGRIVQYTGVTNSSYTHGYFYECKESDGSYSWVQTNVQSSSGGGGGASWHDVGTTLAAGQTSVTISSSLITSQSVIDVYTDADVEYTSLTVGIGSVTITFEAQQTDLLVMVRITSNNMHFMPNGKTATPVNDVPTWIRCASVFDSTYTTILEVLNDSRLLATLIASTNAVDYMARSTSWAADVCADEDAMTAIGNDNYCADTLLADNTWLATICNSAYFESVLNVKVPVMTSDITPSGKASASSYLNGNYLAWKAFNGTAKDAFDAWHSDTSGRNNWIQYEFPSGTNYRVYKIHLATRNGTTGGGAANVTFKRTADGPTIFNFSYTDTSNKSYDFVVSNNNSGNICRLERGGNWVIGWCNFYGRAII